MTLLLLAIDVDVAELLPADDATEGFDNIADALGTSPSLIQGYVSAAMKISRRAVGDRTAIPTQITYTAASGLAQDRHIEGLPLGTRGGLLVQHTFPMDAEYEFNVGGGFGGGAPGSIIDVTIDGEKLFFDPILSKNRRISCASCHKPAFAFADNVPFSFGVDSLPGDRNTPSVMNSAGNHLRQ